MYLVMYMHLLSTKLFLEVSITTAADNNFSYYYLFIEQVLTLYVNPLPWAVKTYFLLEKKQQKKKF